MLTLVFSVVKAFAPTIKMRNSACCEFHLLLVAAKVGFEEYSWARDYWAGHPPIYAILLLRAIGPISWCMFFASACLLAAIHLVRHNSPPSTYNPNGYRAFLFCATLLGLNATGIAYLDRVLNPAPDLNSCEIDRLHRLGCVHGVVMDENNKPVNDIEVNLTGAFESEDARRLGSKSQWTDKQGRYNFNFVDSGDYILAVNPFESSPGPDKQRPFETRSEADEVGADRITVIQPSAANLPPLRLRSSKFTTIEVIVEWGTGHAQNVATFSFRTRATGVCFGGFEEIENGVGKIDLAQGFEYVANARPNASVVTVQNSDLATPSQKFKVAESDSQTQLRLVLLGSPCVLREAR